MANTKIRGNTQIIDASIENAQIAADAAIVYSKLSLATSITNGDLAGSIATSKLTDGAEFLKRDGSVALTAAFDAGNFKLTNVANGVAATDAITKGQLDTAIASVNTDVNVVNLDEVITREIPTGLVNSLNTVFTLAFTPELGTENVFLNGLLQDLGGSEDYTIAGAVITFNQAPHTVSKIRVNYIKM
jgi:hypothetical protein